MVKKIGWGILLLVGICLSGERGFGEEFKFQYIRKVLFTIPYGYGDNQIMIGAEARGNICPRGFWIDKKGDIYIHNETKIKKFDKDGNLIFATEGEFYMGAFKIDDNGNIFVSSGVHRTTKFDNTGRFVHHIMYDPIDEIVYDTIIDETMYDPIGEGDIGNDTKKTMTSLPPEIAEIPSFKRPPLIDGQGRRYDVTYEDPYGEDGNPKTIVNIYSPQQENPIGSFTIAPKEKRQLPKISPKGTISLSHINLPDYEGIRTHSISIQWIDGEGNLYGITDAKRKKPIILGIEHDVELESGIVDIPIAIEYDEIIYKYNSRGEFITQLRYPGSIGGLDQHNKVDKDGNIYCLQFHKKGMDVVKYEWKAGAKDEKKRE